jgi:polyhydroxyalkanoate synthesis regulator phasin/type IV secretory pathway VirB10-like protein
MMIKIKGFFQQNPKMRNLVIVLAVIIIAVVAAGIYKSQGGSSSGQGAAQITKVPDSATGFVPGSKGLSKQYLQTLLSSEDTQAQQAIQAGKSALPSLIGTQTGSTASVQQPTQTNQLTSDCCQRLNIYCKGLTAQQTPDALLDQWQKQGQVTSETADALKKLQGQNLSSGDYASALGQMVKAGKITPDQAKQLLSSYKQQQVATTAQTLPTANDLADQLTASGTITADTASQLKKLSNGGASADDYSAALDQMVKDGKITPDQAKQLLASYKQQPSGTATTGTAAPTTSKLTDQLVTSGEVTPEAAAALKKVSDSGASASQYGEKLNQLVKDGKLTPQAAQKLLQAYHAEKGNGVTPTGDAQMDQLQQSQADQAYQQQLKALQDQADQQQQTQQSQDSQVLQKKQQALQAMQQAISAQAQQLFASWNTEPQSYVQATVKDTGKNAKGGGGSSQANGGGAQQGKASGYPLVKAGTIMFGVLDTGVNSDQAGPVMATIVSGKLKGAKLIGGLTQTSDGQRVTLTFTSLTMPDWPDVIAINAVAINPDTAHTAIASSVDNHYLLRYGSLMASSFLEGYSEAVRNAGTTVLNAGTTTTTTDALSSSERLMVGLGEVGKQLGANMKDTFNRKPTVKVDAGVGMGLLFVSNVSKTPFTGGAGTTTGNQQAAKPITTTKVTTTDTTTDTTIK